MPNGNKTDSKRRQDLKAAYLCLGFAVVLSVLSLALGTVLDYREHGKLFNILAVLMLGLGFASLFICIRGIIGSRFREPRLVIMGILSALYICWLIFMT